MTERMTEKEIEEQEQLDRKIAKLLGITYEEFMKRQERNRGMIDLRKAEVVAEDGQVYYIDEYEEKFEGKVNPRGPVKISSLRRRRNK